MLANHTNTREAAVYMHRMTLADKKRLEGLWFVLPALIFMIALIGYPLVYNFYLSFRNLNVKTFNGDTSVFVGLENYRALFADGTFLTVLKNTFAFTILSLVFQFSIGFVLALLFSQKFRIGPPVRGLMLVGYMMPASVTALIFRSMMAADGGILNDILMKLHILTEPVGWLISQNTVLYSVVLANCWIGIPFNMLLMTSGLTNIPTDVYEAAKIDGATSWKRFVHITLPLLKSTMISVLTLGFIYTFKVFDLIYMMTGGGPLHASEVLSTYSYHFSFVKYEFSTGAAAANIMFLCLFVVGLIYLYLQIKGDEA